MNLLFHLNTFVVPFNTFAYKWVDFTKQKNNEEKVEPNNTNEPLDMTDIIRLLHPRAENALISKLSEPFNRVHTFWATKCIFTN